MATTDQYVRPVSKYVVADFPPHIDVLRTSILNAEMDKLNNALSGLKAAVDRRDGKLVMDQLKAMLAQSGAVSNRAAARGIAPFMVEMAIIKIEEAAHQVKVLLGENNKVSKTYADAMVMKTRDLGESYQYAHNA